MNAEEGGLNFSQYAGAHGGEYDAFATKRKERVHEDVITFGAAVVDGVAGRPRRV